MRGRVSLEYIADEVARKATYLRRKNGLLKKLKELTVLSGRIDACALIYSEFNDQPEQWPTSSLELQRIITKFRSYPELERGKKMLNLESLLDELILKANEKLAKMETKNREIQMSLRMFELLANKNITQTFTKDELNQTAWTIDEKLKQVEQRIIELNNNASTSQSQAQVADPTLAAADGGIMQGEAQAQVADPTLVADGEIMQGEAQAQVADGACMQAEAQVNHGQSYEMNKKATQDFASFLKHINGGDDDSSA